MTAAEQLARRQAAAAAVLADFRCRAEAGTITGDEWELQAYRLAGILSFVLASHPGPGEDGGR